MLPIRRTRAPWDGITSRRWRSTPAPKVGTRNSVQKFQFSSRPIRKCNPSKSLTSALSVYPPLSPIKILSRNIYCCFVYFKMISSFVKKHPLFCLYLPLSPPSDYKVGFGGKFGVQTDRQDKSAAGWDHVEKVEKHESQVDHKKGFGGKYGVGVQDKSAVGWEHHEILEKHESQKGGLCTSALICLHIFSHLFCFLCMFILLHIQDYKTGFGGQFGVQKDRVDASAAGWDHVEKVPKHPSQQGRFPSMWRRCSSTPASRARSHRWWWWWGLEKAPKQDFLSIMHEP